MTCATHAIIGATLGRLAGHRGAAFVAGVASHVVADLLPHRDYDVPREAALLAAALAVVAARHGVGSPAWYGALGAVAPDLENALSIVTGLEPRLRFPTHDGWHGAVRRETWSQSALALALLAVTPGTPRG